MRRLTIAVPLLLAAAGGTAVAQLPGLEEEEEEEEAEAVSAPTPTPIPAAGPATVASPSWTDLIEVHGFASFAYTFNTNDPASDANQLRVFDLGHNNFTLDVAELTLMHTADEVNDVGFRVDFEVGTTVPAVSSSIGLGKGVVEVPPDATLVIAEQWDLQQAYVTWIAPVGDGLKIDAGKFVTWAGAEVIEGWDGFNDNYSRGLLFGYALPFAHTGVRAGYPVNDKVTLSGMITNGWDVAVDNNNGKTWGLNAAVAASDTIDVYATYIGGPEQNDDSDLRHLIDVVGVVKVGEQITATGNVDFGVETFDDESATWFGVAGHLKYAVDDQISVTGRAELFRDPDGVRTGVDDQQLISLTATPAYEVGDHVVLRSDLRLDLSNQDAFDAGEASKTQFTIGLNALAYY